MGLDQNLGASAEVVVDILALDFEKHHLLGGQRNAGVADVFEREVHVAVAFELVFERLVGGDGLSGGVVELGLGGSDVGAGGGEVGLARAAGQVGQGLFSPGQLRAGVGDGLLGGREVGLARAAGQVGQRLFSAGQLRAGVGDGLLGGGQVSFARAAGQVGQRLFSARTAC